MTNAAHANLGKYPVRRFAECELSDSFRESPTFAGDSQSQAEFGAASRGEVFCNSA